jgi:hypothetical protein
MGHTPDDENLKNNIEDKLGEIHRIGGDAPVAEKGMSAPPPLAVKTAADRYGAEEEDYHSMMAWTFMREGCSSLCHADHQRSDAAKAIATLMAERPPELLREP